MMKPTTQQGMPINEKKLPPWMAKKKKKVKKTKKAMK